jgi:ethanolamine utilization protein EutN
MKIGTVTGSVWATKKCPALTGHSFLTVHLDTETVVAVDFVGAGQGDTVLVTRGASAARKLDAPIDASIVAILDREEQLF